MPFQANIFTGGFEKANHKARDQTEEQMELDALTYDSASLRGTMSLTKVTTIGT